MPYDRYYLTVLGTALPFSLPMSMDAIRTLMNADALDTVVIDRKDGRAKTVMLVDDAGHDKGLPMNIEATRMYHAVRQPGTTYVIRGPVFVCPDQDFGA